jgi:hypothetical protein
VIAILFSYRILFLDALKGITKVAANSRLYFLKMVFPNGRINEETKKSEIQQENNVRNIYLNTV